MTMCSVIDHWFCLTLFSFTEDLVFFAGLWCSAAAVYRLDISILVVFGARNHPACIKGVASFVESTFLQIVMYLGVGEVFSESSRQR
mmetsp:Transcript_35860/g.86473  ORF Transcript_35860/g.86473 Transcript_35860/m.86473 type:complete len:87 (-) Transcript_35860:147-407(-)